MRTQVSYKLCLSFTGQLDIPFITLLIVLYFVKMNPNQKQNPLKRNYSIFLSHDNYFCKQINLLNNFLEAKFQ